MGINDTSFIIYKAECLTTHKVYIGLTSKGMRERKRKHFVDVRAQWKNWFFEKEWMGRDFNKYPKKVR